jgi:acyl-homoserine lactone acylase PvdQ
LTFRSQHALELIHNERKLTLEEVVDLKHSMRMLLADRVKEEESGKQVASRGDGWILAVELSDPPRAYSVLAYGQSSREESPHHDDQAELFARNQLKKVAFTEDEIRAQLLRKYRPGSEKN